MPSEKYVIGSGAVLAWALASWAEVAPDETLRSVDIGQDGDYQFDLGVLADISPRDATDFVAWGPHFLNFRRLELMGELKGRGFRMPPLVCRGAVVSATTVLGENCAVGAGAIVGSGCKIGFNSHIGAGALIGCGVQLGSSVWIADGVQIGPEARIGANATLGRGVILDDGVVVGRQSILDLPGRRAIPLPDKTFVTASFPTGAVVIEGGGNVPAF